MRVLRSSVLLMFWRNFFKFLSIMCEYVHVSASAKERQNCPLRSEVRGSCEPFCMGAGKHTQVLCKSSKRV